MSEHHMTRLETVYPSGAELWACKTCRYRFIVQWQPKMKRVVLEEGELGVLHGGSTGGLSMSADLISDKYDGLFKRKP